MRPQDLDLLHACGRPALTPDGRSAVVAVTRPDLASDSYGGQLWRVPTDGSADKLAELATNPVTGSSVTYSLDGDVVTTTLTYEAKGGTVFAIRPHQAKGLDSSIATDLGTFPSIYGTLTLCAGTELTWTVPLP